MARTRRQLSTSGCYHIMLRGVNREPIFRDEADRFKMTDCLSRYSRETHTEIVVYCLMNNHLHLLVFTEDEPSLFIKKIASSYVYYFNRKYNRVGHLFQDRFKSEVVETEEYFLTAARYILRNPENAGICRTEQYPWSSWREMEGVPGITDFRRLTDSVGGIRQLKEFILQDNDDKCMDIGRTPRLSDEEAILEIQHITGIRDPGRIKRIPGKEREKLLADLKKRGIPSKQLARITGISIKAIRSAE